MLFVFPAQRVLFVYPARRTLFVYPVRLMLFMYPARRALFMYPVQQMLFICLAQRTLFVGSAYINDVPPPEAVEAGVSFPFTRPVPVPEVGALLSVSGVSD